MNTQGTLPGPQRIGVYQIVRPIGSGGMGIVYEARHQQLGRRVALKILHPRFASDPAIVARFLNEARAVNIVEHPSLVQISDLGQLQDGTVFLVMEFLHGEPLRARLQRSGTLPVRSAVLLCAQLASALAATHKKGIVHRDLKPDNVMLVPDPVAPGGERAKLLDFGIAKMGYSLPDSLQTNPDAVLGTPHYMAPEQCRGAGGVTDRADVYALGVLLFQTLAGTPPFQAAGAGAIMAMHIYQPVPPLPSEEPLPQPLRALVTEMLAKDAEARPSMQAVFTRLQALVSAGEVGGDVQPQLPAPPEQTDGAITTTLGSSSGQRFAVGRPLAPLLIGVVLAVGVGAAGWSQRQGRARFQSVSEPEVVGLSTIAQDMKTVEPDGSNPALLTDLSAAPAAPPVAPVVVQPQPSRSTAPRASSRASTVRRSPLPPQPLLEQPEEPKVPKPRPTIDGGVSEHGKSPYWN